MIQKFLTVYKNGHCHLFKILVLVSYSLVSCETNSEDFFVPISQTPPRTETLNDLVVDTLSTSYAIDEKSNVRVFVSLFGNDLHYSEFDINNDSIADIGFFCSLTRGPIGIYSYGNSGISTLNENTQIDVINTIYPVANYSETYINPSTGQPVTIHQQMNYNENMSYPADLKIDTILSECPVVHSLGDTLSQANNWKSGSFEFIYDHSQQDYWHINIQTGIWRNIDHKFIGIRYSEGRHHYYGWFEIKAAAEGYEIRIYRYALRLVR